MIHFPARLALLLGAIALGTACKSAGFSPIDGVRAADDMRAGLLATVTIAPLDRISGDVDGLSRALGLPFQGKDLLTMLAAQNRLDPTTTQHIDTAQPIALAFVAPAGKNQEPLGAAVLAGRGKDGAANLVAALGTVGETRKGTRKITRSDGSTLWVATHESSVFASASFEGLSAAALLAREAQKAQPSDVVVNLFPDAVARWQGTDVRTALTGLRKGMLDEQITAAQRRGGPVPGAAERLIYETVLDSFLDPLAQSASGALTLDLDAARGIRLGLRLEPRKGSAFGKQIGAPTPYAVDPALFVPGDTDPVAAVWAVGPSPFWLEVYDRVLAAQARAGTSGAAEVGKHYQALRPHVTGAGSGLVRVHRGALANDAVVPLRAGSPAALDAMAALAGSRGFSELLAAIYGGATPRVQARRERDTLRTELAFPLRNRPGDPGTALKAFFGSPTLSLLATVAGGRLLMATEPDAAPRLAALAAARARAPLPDLQNALNETRGQDGFLYLDVWSLVKPSLAVAAPQQAQMLGLVTNMPGFSQLKLPVVMSYKGGPALDAELRLPLSTLTNAAAVARPFLGMAR